MTRTERFTAFLLRNKMPLSLCALHGAISYLISCFFGFAVQMGFLGGQVLTGLTCLALDKIYTKEIAESDSEFVNRMHGISKIVNDIFFNIHQQMVVNGSLSDEQAQKFLKEHLDRQGKLNTLLK